MRLVKLKHECISLQTTYIALEDITALEHLDNRLFDHHVNDTEVFSKDLGSQVIQNGAFLHTQLILACRFEAGDTGLALHGLGSCDFFLDCNSLVSYILDVACDFAITDATSLEPNHVALHLIVVVFQAAFDLVKDVFVLDLHGLSQLAHDNFTPTLSLVLFLHNHPWCSNQIQVGFVVVAL